MSNYRNQLEAYLKTQEIWADRVIDIGGRANPIKDRVKDWQVKDYVIYDNALEEGENDYIKLDLNKFEEYNRLEKIEKADYTFCLEVMEYIYKPNEALNILNILTKSNGILYITFPFIYPVHEPKQNDYLRYTCDGACRLLGEAGFKILEIMPRVMTPRGFELWKEFMIAEGMHWSKHSRHDQLGFIFKAQKV